ncbi:imidazolonepropionase [Gangjinia marincola]|uniref:Imidazolonepropionase n=1 Tax=Gangjinia marincola TaxID=578463 RepID=A0ABP3XVH2_9FLAO
MKVLFKHIKQLVGIDVGRAFVAGAQMNELNTIENAFILVEDEIIIDYGKMEECMHQESDEIVDCRGSIVVPAWCDSHTHLVYAGNRESEFVDRIKGATYEEIAAKGGGILNSARKLQQTSFDELYEQSRKRLEGIMRMGTGAVEIKSGYGLTTEAELKMLRVIKKLKENYPIQIKATFLGAHAMPTEFKKNKQGYTSLLIDEMLPAIADENLADFIDVFCEEGYFSVQEMEQILEAGAKYGLVPKVHVNQFNALGGIAAAVKHNARSVDHLEVLTVQDIKALTGSNTMPVALPGCSFFLGIPYTPARTLINANLPVALATDYNPGSAPSGNMNFVLSTACIKLNMSPTEAINAATLNGAYAMNLEDSLGSIKKGKLANLIITQNVPSLGYLPYSFGEDNVKHVYLKGQKIV